MKKIIILFLVPLVASCIFVSCSTQENIYGTSDIIECETRVIKDSLGRSIEIPFVIDSLVALGNTPRMITYLGLSDKVVGFSGLERELISPLQAYAYVNKELWAKVPSTGTDAFGNTDYYPELIISVRPDVIFCTYPEDIVNDIQSKTNIPVVAVPIGILFQKDYEDALRVIGSVCGAEKRAEEVITFINSHLQYLDDKTAKIVEGPTVLAAAATFKGEHGIEGVRVKNPIFEAINANNIAGGVSTEAATVIVDKEQILRWNPDFIFFDSGGMAIVNQDYRANPGYYDKLNAYKNFKTYQYPSSTSYFDNVEISLANCYYVASLLYPEQFVNVDVNAKANEIFKFFLGVDDYLNVLNEIGAGYSQVSIGER